MNVRLIGLQIEMNITSEKLTQTNLSEAWHVLRQLRNELQEARGWHCHVHDLAVDQTYRRQGIGSKVIKYLQSVVQKQSGNWIFLDGIDNALGFYEKIGFRHHAATLLKLKITA